MSNPTNTSLFPTPVSTGLENCKRHSITVNIDFSIGLTYSLDLTAIQDQLAWIKSVQTLFIDNSANSNAITIRMSGTLQRVVIPGYAQAYIPVLQINPPVLTFTSASPVQVAVQILDFFLPPCVWSASGALSGTIAVADAILDATVVGGKVQVSQVPLTIQGLTDASGTIAVGGTVQALVPASASRQRWTLANPSTATEILQFGYGAPPTHFIDLAPGATWDESGSSIVGDAVQIKAATAAHAFTCFYK